MDVFYLAKVDFAAAAGADEYPANAELARKLAVVSSILTGGSELRAPIAFVPTGHPSGASHRVDQALGDREVELDRSRTYVRKAEPNRVHERRRIEGEGGLLKVAGRKLRRRNQVTHIDEQRGRQRRRRDRCPVPTFHRPATLRTAVHHHNAGVGQRVGEYQ